MATVWTSLTRWVDTTAATLLPHHWRPSSALRPMANKAGASAAGPALAHTDAITGLPDRAAFEQVLDDAVHGCDTRQHTLAVIYIGLDNFRLVNEGYGHAVGDALLAQVPARLRSAVPTMAAAMRNAGDEFVLLLPIQPGDTEAPHAAAQQLREALRQPFPVDGLLLTVDVSIGISLYPRHGARARLVLQAAAAMRSVKQAGGGAHAEFEPAMGVDMRQQAELLRDLRHAVDLRALQLVYQPKVDARTRQVTGAEALLRWHDERRGVISPAVFVPLAEKHGIIAGIGRWVIEEACRQAAAWRDQGLWLRVAVNVSGQQLRQDDWVEHLVASLRQHQVPPSRFTVEITESVAMEDTRVTREAFERLRQAGVHVSIDDFGTGHSSLASLRKLPAAELKIDRAFVTDLDSSGHARAIVSTVVHMAHELDLRVVAEGVETDAQRDWLLHMGCDELQGYLFARPMSAAALAVWVLDERGNGLAPPLPPPTLLPEPPAQALPAPVGAGAATALR